MTAKAEKISSKQAAINALKKANRPMKTAEIVEAVLATPGVSLAGKTPGATIAAQLAVSNKNGGPFERTEPGTYRLRAETNEKKAETKKADEPKKEQQAESGDEFSGDLKEAAAAADRKASGSKQAKPDPKKKKETAAA